MVSFIVPCRKGGFLIGLAQTVSHFDWDTKKVTVLASVDEGKNTRFNDAKCDASGRLWCGKPHMCLLMLNENADEKPQCRKTYLLTSAPNEDSKQPAHPRNLIRIFFSFSALRYFASLDF